MSVWSQLFALPNGDLVAVGALETETDADAFATRITETGLATGQGAVRLMSPAAFEQMLTRGGRRVSDLDDDLWTPAPTDRDEFNDCVPVGTTVRAFPGTRDGRAVITETRSRAWPLGNGVPVVAVEGESGGIALTHIDIAEPAVRAGSPA